MKFWHGDVLGESFGRVLEIINGNVVNINYEVFIEMCCTMYLSHQDVLLHMFVCLNPLIVFRGFNWFQFYNLHLVIRLLRTKCDF